MIEFHYLSEFRLEDETKFSDWITRIVSSEGKLLGDINYIFCNDGYLLNINQKFLKHDTYTDIITFDYTHGKLISGDVYISIDRVEENAAEFKEDFLNEILRVMSHGVLHLLDYKDKSDDEAAEMRDKEDEKMKLFHVEQ